MCFLIFFVSLFSQNRKTCYEDTIKGKIRVIVNDTTIVYTLAENSIYGSDSQETLFLVELSLKSAKYKRRIVVRDFDNHKLEEGKTYAVTILMLKQNCWGPSYSKILMEDPKWGYKLLYVKNK